MLKFPNWFTLLFLGIDSAVIAVAVGEAIYLERPITMYFHEEAYTTQLSALQLLIASGLAWAVFRLQIDTINLKKLRKFNLRSLQSPSALWLIIALGFMFLAIDEIWQLHEGVIQNSIFALFNLKKNFITVRINDFVILLYGLLGVISVYFYLPAIKNDRDRNHRTLQHLTIGFVLLFLMVILDTLGNRKEIPYIAQILPTATNLSLRRSLKVFEETVQLFSEAFFVGAFYSALQSARSQCFARTD